MKISHGLGVFHCIVHTGAETSEGLPTWVARYYPLIGTYFTKIKIYMLKKIGRKMFRNLRENMFTGFKKSYGSK